MWALILSGLALGTIVGLLYLAGRFAKFGIIKKAAGGRRLRAFLLGLVPVALLAAAVDGVLGRINLEICILHMTVIWLLCDGIGGLAERKCGKKFKRYYAGIFALGISALYLTWGWFLANYVRPTYYTVDTEKKVEDLRIVLIADSHIGNTFSGEGFNRWVRDMQAEEPDIVVITGDYVDDDTMKEDMIAACAALGTLETTYGVYYVFGNHDKGYYDPEYRGYNERDLIEELEKNNVTVLQDDIVLLDNRFYLIGRQDRFEDYRGAARASMEELTEGLDPDKYMVVLDHQPYDYDAQEAAEVDLVLSGHTHGGQFFPINHIGEWTGTDAKTYGLEKRGNTNFIVTSGISNWAIKFRTGCKAEYVVIDVAGQPR